MVSSLLKLILLAGSANCEVYVNVTNPAFGPNIIQEEILWEDKTISVVLTNDGTPSPDLLEVIPPEGYIAWPNFVDMPEATDLDVCIMKDLMS